MLPAAGGFLVTTRLLLYSEKARLVPLLPLRRHRRARQLRHHLHHAVLHGLCLRVSRQPTPSPHLLFALQAFLTCICSCCCSPLLLLLLLLILLLCFEQPRPAHCQGQHHRPQHQRNRWLGRRPGKHGPPLPRAGVRHPVFLLPLRYVVGYACSHCRLVWHGFGSDGHAVHCRLRTRHEQLRTAVFVYADNAGGIVEMGN